jgi:hypothetical protein
VESELQRIGKTRWVVERDGQARAGEDEPVDDKEWDEWYDGYLAVKLVLEGSLGECQEVLKNHRYKALGSTVRMLERVKVLREALIEHNSVRPLSSLVIKLVLIARSLTC